MSILSGGFFFSAFLHSFLQSLENRNLFLPSSLNWMQFIASTKLVFHRPWQPMRICLLSVASGANMQKVAAGRRDSVKGRREGKAGGHSPESIHDRARERWVCLLIEIWPLGMSKGERKGYITVRLNQRDPSERNGQMNNKSDKTALSDHGSK